MPDIRPFRWPERRVFLHEKYEEKKNLKSLQLIDLLGGAGRGLDAGVVRGGAGGLEEGGQLHLHQRARGQALYPPIYSIENNIMALFKAVLRSRNYLFRLRRAANPNCGSGSSPGSE
jgi:hypothetical protein